METTSFNKKEIEKCFNVWKEESYETPILSKVYPIYNSYIREKNSLIGNGEIIGYIALFSGKAYRGMGALGCSIKRARGIGILYADKKNRMWKELEPLGLSTSKLSNMKFKGLNSNEYVLVIDKETEEYDNGNSSIRLTDIRLVGKNGDTVDLLKNWSNCYTLDFK
jgi:hypothetical protein